MSNTPKLQRKSSLSLTTRLNNKRHSSSPQNIVKTAITNNGLNNRETNSRIEVPRSPSIISISDCGIECTPPHKKIGMTNVEDCADYSPKVFDNSFSPSCLLSQTLAIDSPEVGWKWSRANEESSTRTPDSAYAADSSFTSADSSSTEMTKARTRTDTYHRRLAYDVRREQELRRVEKTLADQKLKQRCAKLQEQLKGAGTQKSSSSPSIVLDRSGNAPSTSTTTDSEMTSQTTTSTVKLVSPMETGEVFNDFFNDSDEDCFLLAATQEIESKINAQIQTVPNTAPSRTRYVEENGTNSKVSPASDSPSASPASSSATCPSAAKEKRSSFYMKFLEDDCTDDWFVSLDEAIEQATQSKKPRTSFQRYKSMPMQCKDEQCNASKSGGASSDPVLNVNTSDDSFVDSVGLSSTSMRSKIKRHSSTHALSPSSANYPGRRHH